MEKKTKAIGLFSGGLDSVLAAKLILDQGIEVKALTYTMVFCDRPSKEPLCGVSKRAAAQLGIPIEIIDVSEEYLKIVKKPRHGYGRGMNPCVDCRIFFLRQAKEYMEKLGAAFVFTGEVAGQRPMSQKKKTMNIIERESGLSGFLIRPLSAKLFPVSVPEETGIVDRNNFFSMSGRSRKPQMLLAEKFGIKDYCCGMGGCLLTDKGFAGRLKDLFKHKPDFDIKDVELLKYGRHFRVSPETKLVVSRRESENHSIASLRKENDVILFSEEPLGPVSLLRGARGGHFINEAASIIARYALGKDSENEAKVRYYEHPRENLFQYVMAKPFNDTKLNLWRL